MQVTRFSSLLLSFLALFIVVHASPAPSKRQATENEISTIVTTLYGSVEGILPSLRAFDPANTTAPEVAPLLQELEAAFTTAGGAFTALSPPSTKRELDLVSRQTAFDEEIAALVAGLLEDVAAALEGLLGVPGLGAILPGLDGPINEVLVGLETLLAGVLRLVAALLIDVAGLLEALGFALTLATLGF